MAGYVKRQWRRAKKWAKKRYMRRGGIARLAKDVAYVKSLVNSELKMKEFNGAGTMAVGTSSGWSSVNSLNTISQDDTTSGREGAQVRMKSIQVKYNLERVAGNHRVRTIILLDKQPMIGTGTVGTVVSPSDVFASPTDLNSLRAWDGIQQRRFKILYSKTWDVDADELQHDSSIYKKLNIPVRWLTTGASSTDIISNRLYLIFMSDNVTATDVTYSFRARLTYRDN